MRKTLDSMKPELSNLFIDYESVKEIWEMVNRLYSQLEEESRIADLNAKAKEMHKNRGVCYGIQMN